MKVLSDIDRTSLLFVFPPLPHYFQSLTHLWFLLSKSYKDILLESHFL